jgi:hypothetical protein
LIENEFDVQTEAISTDVESFLSEMTAAGLVDAQNVGAAA